MLVLLFVIAEAAFVPYYGYYGEPLEVDLDGETIALGVQGRASSREDFVEILVNGEVWRELHILAHRPKRWVKGQWGNHELTARCRAVWIGRRYERTVTSCVFLIDGKRVGAVTPANLLFTEDENENE